MVAEEKNIIELYKNNKIQKIFSNSQLSLFAGQINFLIYVL